MGLMVKRMDTEHHCNNCPYWHVIPKRYPSGFYNITICEKYNEQIYYLAGEKNQTPHPCNMCAEQFSYVPYIKQEIWEEVDGMTERLSDNCPCNKCGKDKKCVLAKEACEDFLKWEDNCIKKLAEYETAEEEGRLVVLPCKPWDKVYALFIVDVIDKKPIYKIFQAKVTKITIDRFRVLFSFETLGENKYNSERTMEAFGETVFLTREEAEKALKEMEGKK